MCSKWIQSSVGDECVWSLSLTHKVTKIPLNHSKESSFLQRESSLRKPLTSFVLGKTVNCFTLNPPGGATVIQLQFYSQALKYTVCIKTKNKNLYKLILLVLFEPWILELLCLYLCLRCGSNVVEKKNNVCIRLFSLWKLCHGMKPRTVTSQPNCFWIHFSNTYFCKKRSPSLCCQN